MKELGVGIIGCGTIAPNYAKSVAELPGARLVAVADIIPEKARKFAETHGAQAWYDDYRALLERDDVDLVCICTPSGLHGQIGIDAARAGKHVLTEKPMDVTLEQADRLIEACRSAGVKLGVVFQRRFAGISRAIKKAVEDGDLGKLILGDVYLKYYRGQEYYDQDAWRGTWALDGGGVLMNQGIHGIDLLQWFMGPVASVYAHTATMARRIEAEDTAVAVVRFASGALGIIEGSTAVYPGLDHRIEISGEKGTILVEGEEIKRWEIAGDEQKKPVATWDIGVDKIARNPSIIGIGGHKLQIADMLDAIRNDREPAVNGEEGRKALAIILAIYRSAATGQPVDF